MELSLPIRGSTEGRTVTRTMAPKATEPNPFDSEAALAHSRYYGTKGGRAVLIGDSDATPDLFASAAVGAFRGFVLNPRFSCVGAKSAVMHESYRLGVYDQLAGPGATAGLCRDLFTFTREVEASETADFQTFVAIFREPIGVDEREFERLLWAQLREINIRDAKVHDWTAEASPDPDDPHFAFSFAGSSFFIVGLHPRSSREARRFPWPTLVFNPHAQFEHLKQEGRWERLQAVIRAREEQLQGSLNPNLADYGTASEARQYSGRAVEADWQPPFAAYPSPHPAAMASGVGGCPFLNGSIGKGEVRS